MPVIVDIDPALLKWQARHGQKMTYTELADRADITLAALNRLKNGINTHIDLEKINSICKVLECDPADLLIRQETTDYEELETRPLEERLQERADIEEAKKVVKKLKQMNGD